MQKSVVCLISTDVLSHLCFLCAILCDIFVTGSSCDLRFSKINASL